MSYLDRLKRLESGDNFQYIPIIEPSKPSKAPFEPFEGTHTGLYVKNISANDSQPIAELVVAKIASKPETRKDRQREEGRQKAIAMMEASPDVPRAIYTDTEFDPDNVVVFVASRIYQQTCVLLIPRAKYDPFKLMALIERQGADHAL